jgi:Protein of unknown function (DUF1552)
MRRRTFMGGLAALTATSPLLRPTSVFAADGAPKRVVFFMTGSGTNHADFFSTSFPNNLTSSAILSPLAPYADRLTVIRGLDREATSWGGYTAADHIPDYTSAMAGRPPIRGELRAGCSNAVEDRCREWGTEGSTIDQFLAGRIGAQGGPSAIMNVGVNAQAGGYTPLSFANGRAYWPQNDPAIAFRDWFTAGTPTSGGSTRDRRLRILDAVRGDASRLRCRLGSAYRESFDQHMGALESIEQMLNAAGTCSAPDQTTSLTGPHRTALLQARMIGAAFRCDLTRVAIYNFSHSAINLDFLGRPDIVDAHNFIHDGGTESERLDVQTLYSRWHAEQLANLCAELASAREIDGSSILDNTVIVWTHEHGVTRTHSRVDVPYAMVGTLGGFFKPGGYAFERRNNNDLLTTLCHGFGFDDVSTYGVAELCRGPLSELIA